MGHKVISIRNIHLYSVSTTGSLERAVEVSGLVEWQQTGNCSCLLRDALVCEGYTFWQANKLFSDKPALYSTLLLPMRKPFITPSYALVHSCTSLLSVLPPFSSTFPPLYPSLHTFLLTALPKLTPRVGASHCSCRDFIQILLLPQGNPSVIAPLSGPSFSHRWHATHQTLPLRGKQRARLVWITL